MYKYFFSIALFFAGLLVACSGNSEDPPIINPANTTEDPEEEVIASYIESSALPGFVRVYALQDSDEEQPREATRTVEGEYEVPGVGPIPGVVRARSDYGDGTYTLAWIGIEDDKLKQYRSEDYNSEDEMIASYLFTTPAITLDTSAERLNVGAIWEQDRIFDAWVLSEGTQVVSSTYTEAWTTLATDELVKVPAGRYRCLHVKIEQRKVDGEITIFDKWYARGIGLVRNSIAYANGASTEVVLKSFSVPEGSKVDANGEEGGTLNSATGD